MIREETADGAAFMRLALRLARRAATRGEVPVGAVVVRDGAVVGRGSNRRERANDPTGHAEILALRQAARAIGDWRLAGTTLYVTLEPCVMCAGAIVNARVPRVVYGCRDPKGGAVDSLYDIMRDRRLNHRVDVENGILERECSIMLREFFQRLRIKGEMTERPKDFRGKARQPVAGAPAKMGERRFTEREPPHHRPRVASTRVESATDLVL
ncbi:MAG: tRNA adenosine(34) deaminase TadA [Deltaproteobacteria bacterium]|nr:tRNA adenosine(34) deaminase TadA [Deltaproteobacteria bacterium]